MEKKTERLNVRVDEDVKRKLEIMKSQSQKKHQRDTSRIDPKRTSQIYC